MDYLKSLTIDEIGDIGMAVGLSFATLRSLSPDNYHSEMVKAWLSRLDNVAATGTPTWKLLGAELQKMRKIEITERIMKGLLLQGGFQSFWKLVRGLRTIGLCKLLCQHNPTPLYIPCVRPPAAV